MEQDADRPHHQVQVWDIATRIFHWSLVIFVCINLFLVDPEGGTATIVHFISGFVIFGLLIFRLFWGFVGSEYSRFADFIYSPSKTIAYGRQLLRRRPGHYPGHNPLGGWMIVFLLIILMAMVGTGLFASTRHAAGPLAHLVTAPQSATAGLVHSVLSNVLIALIIGHIAGVAFDWIITRENLIRSMFTGRKAVPGTLSKPMIAPARRAIIVALVAIAAFGTLAATTDYSATRDTLGWLSRL